MTLPKMPLKDLLETQIWYATNQIKILTIDTDGHASLYTQLEIGRYRGQIETAKCILYALNTGQIDLTNKEEK